MTPAELLAKAFDDHAGRVAASVGTLHQEIERLVPELAREHIESVLTKNGLLSPPQPAKRSVVKFGRDVPVAKAADFPKNKSASQSHRAKSPGVPTCSKCSKPGHNARTCGRVTTEPDEEDDAEEETPTSSPPPISSKPDRFARIEAQANARRSPAAPARVDAGARPRGGAARPIRTDGDARGVVTPALPTPTATFTV